MNQPLRFFVSLFTLLLFSTVVISNFGCNGEDQQNVIVILNGKEITDDLLENYFRENLDGNFAEASVEITEQTENETNKVKSRLLEDFIDLQLVFEQVEKAGVSIEERETAKFLQELGEPVETINEVDQKKLEWIKNLLIIQKFKKDKLFSKIHVSEKELKEYFQKQIKGKSERQRYFLEIIVLESKKEAQRVLKKIKSKKSTFDSLAEKHAMIPGKAGPQGYFLDELPGKIKEEVDRLKKGEISGVLPLLERFCIIKMEGTEKARAKPFEEISEDLRKKIIRDKEEALFEDYIHNLRKSSNVKIFYERLPFDFIADR
jgi:parvulin-like peptidyl-prolyl isomerase